MPTIETIRRITVQQTSTGGAAVRADLLATAEAQAKLGDAATQTAVVTELASRRQLSANAAFEKARMAVDGAYAAQVRYERQVNALNRGLESGKKTTEEYNTALEFAQMKLAAATATANKFEAAQRAAARATIEAREAQVAAGNAYQASLNKRLGVGGSGGSDDRAADFEAAAAAADKLRAKYDQLFAAAQRYAATVEEVTSIERAGQLSEEVANASRLKALRTYNDTVQVLERLAQVQKESAQRSVNNNLIVPDRAADIAAYGAEMNRLQAEFDPVFKASLEYEGYLDRVGRALKLGAIDQDVYNARVTEAKTAFDAQIDKLNGVVEVQEKAVKSTGNLRQAWAALSEQGRGALGNIDASRKLGSLSNMQGTVRDDAGNAAARAQIDAVAQNVGEDADAFVESLNKRRAAMVPLVAVNQQFRAVQAQAKKDLAEGVINEDEYTAAINRAKNTQLAQTNELKKAEDAHARLAKGVGLSAYGWQNLSYQVNDVISSLASGISPMQTLSQQGGQIYQVLQGGQGGVKGALAGIAEQGMSVAKAIGPVGGAFAVVTAAVLAGAAAFSSYSTAQMALRQNLAGVGRASGATVGQINAIASASAAAGGVSVREFATMAGAFASTGKIGVEILGDLGKTTKDYAATTGQDLTSATKSLATAFADPARGADELDKQLGILNDTTREHIQRLAMQGDRLGAQKALMEAYKSGLTSATELTSGWARITTAAGNAISDAWTKVGKAIDHVVTGGDLETKIADLQKVLATPPGFLERFSSTRPALQAELDKLLEQQRKQQADAQKKTQDDNSKRIGDIVRGLNPATEQLKQMDAHAKDIRDHLSDLKLPAELEAAQRAMNGLTTAAKQLRSDMEAGGAAYADAIRAAQFQQRTVGFSPESQTVAQINENAANKRLEALRNASTNTDMAAFEKQMQSIETEQKILLENAQKALTIATSAGSGRYSTGIGQVPEQYRALVYGAATAQGLSPDLIASQIRQESHFNPNAVSPAGAQGISQFMPATARGVGLANPFDPAQAIPKQAELMAQLMRQFNNNEVAALIGYNAGPKVAQRFLARGSDVSTLPKETQDYIKAILTPPPNAQALVTAETERTRQLELQRQQLTITEQQYGKNSLQYEAQLAAVNRLSDEQQRGVTITDTYKASIQANAEATASAAQKLKLTQFSTDIGFERDQLGRDRYDQTAFSRARSTVGDTTSPGAQMVIDQSRQTQYLTDARATLTDAATGFATALSHGTSAASAFASALSRIGDKLISGAIDSLMGSLFKSGGGGLLGGIGHLFGFADGGFTGHGGKYEPAGIVHRGEYVIDAATVGRVGRGFFDGLRGYADGGFVTMPDTNAPLAPVAAANANAPAAKVGDTWNLDLRGSSLSHGEVQSAIVQAIAINNAQQSRTQFTDRELARRAFG